MTITAGFNFDDGVLICADTKHSGSGSKLQASKLFVKDDYPNGAKTVFAYAGDMGYSRMAIQHCEAGISLQPSDEVDSLRLRGKIEFELSQIHFGHIYSHPDRPTGQLFVFLIAAVWSPIDGLRLYSTRDSSVMDVRGYDLVGSGDYLGHYLIRQRYRGAGSSLVDVIATAVTALDSIKEHDEGCGGRSELVVMKKDGSITAVKDLEVSQGEEVYDIFNAASNRLLIAISRPDIDDAQLEKQLSEFCSEVESTVKSANAYRRTKETIRALGGGTMDRLRPSRTKK